ncbi:MAG: Nramp family divalent metal transporter [Chloroflexi bacterium]|nr:Nramp family divalent metal transporter [Chloroflexota bacterium]
MPRHVQNEPTTHPHPGVQAAARDAIQGRTHGLRALLPFLGPAFIASIAYTDPGNFATNISAGAQFGYSLLWVILLANLMAMLIQSMAAKLGIATGLNLAELCRARFPPWICYFLWLTQEVTAMATDLAEFLGASIGINLLVGIPLAGAALITAIGVSIVLALQGNGFRGLEAFIGGCALLIALCYVVETVLAGPDWGQIAFHAVVPSLPGANAALLAVGIVGATVMPHVIYVHSNLTRGRVVPATEAEARRVFDFEKVDVAAAMGLAGLVNMAMLFMAARVFYETGHQEVASINSAYETLTPLLGSAAAVVFAISLVTSGIASSHVGTLAGQVVMQGFVNFQIGIWPRRLLTMLPAVVAIFLGLDPTRTLVLSQVTLSFTLPFPVITLIMFTRNRELMGTLVNRPSTTAVAILCAVVIVVLNAALVYQTFGGALPGF